MLVAVCWSERTPRALGSTLTDILGEVFDDPGYAAILAAWIKAGAPSLREVEKRLREESIARYNKTRSKR
jgi:hypothetical protein